VLSPVSLGQSGLAERILRKAKRIQQRAQTKPRQNSIVSEEVTQKKKDP